MGASVGEDDHGIFAEFELRRVRFVWRWIPSGRFLMGSPEEEAGRLSHEGPQREVAITRGFWMGETPVTQAQWLAIKEKNPEPLQRTAASRGEFDLGRCGGICLPIGQTGDGLPRRSADRGPVGVLPGGNQRSIQ